MESIGIEYCFWNRGKRRREKIFWRYKLPAESRVWGSLYRVTI